MDKDAPHFIHVFVSDISYANLPTSLGYHRFLSGAYLHKQTFFNATWIFTLKFREVILIEKQCGTSKYTYMPISSTI